MAEVYWDLEWTLQQQGFDYTYDKRLYDRLREGHATPVCQHLFAGVDFQNKLARFLENHDEPRAAASFPDDTHQAAAVITFLIPGLRLFHQGQLEGRLKRISPHLNRAPEEPINQVLKEFYERFLSVLQAAVFRSGQWQLLECIAAWEGNGSCAAFIAGGWHDAAGARVLVVVNFAGHHSQCYLRIPFPGLENKTWALRDLMSDAAFKRDGNELQARGLYLDLGPWQYHVFEMSAG